jgi:hypothetical protein
LEVGLFPWNAGIRQGKRRLQALFYYIFPAKNREMRAKKLLYTGKREGKTPHTQKIVRILV